MLMNLENLSVANLKEAGLSVSAPREEGGSETAGVPPGMWLEFARRDLQQLEAIGSGGEVN